MRIVISRKLQEWIMRQQEMEPASGAEWLRRIILGVYDAPHSRRGYGSAPAGGLLYISLDLQNWIKDNKLDNESPCQTLCRGIGIEAAAPPMRRGRPEGTELAAIRALAPGEIYRPAAGQWGSALRAVQNINNERASSGFISREDKNEIYRMAKPQPLIHVGPGRQPGSTA